MDRADLSDRRILIVEDEYIIASDLARSLSAHGATLLGPVPTLAAALAVVDSDEAIDAAVLDINLNGEIAYPVADALMRRNVPFVFITGYDRQTLKADYANIPHFQKPIDAQVVVRRLNSLTPGAR